MSNSTTEQTQTLGLSAPEKLQEHHDFSQFDCNEESINAFAKRAHKQAKLKNSVVYVICEKGTHLVKGYYTLSNGSVIRSDTPKNMQRSSPNEIPVIILGRLGVDKSYQGKGVGLDLLKDAIERSIQASKITAARAILVHALNQNLANFYKKYAGFIEGSTISPFTLFLAL